MSGLRGSESGPRKSRQFLYSPFFPFLVADLHEHLDLEGIDILGLQDFLCVSYLFICETFIALFDLVDFTCDAIVKLVGHRC